MCGISHQAVNLAVKAGRVHLTNDRIDPGHPTNQYFQTQPRPGPKSKKAKAAQVVSLEKPEAGPKAAKGVTAETKASKDLTKHLSEQLDLSRLANSSANAGDKYRIDTALSLEKLKKSQIENEKSRGKLIDRELVSAFIAEWYNIEANEFLTLADKMPQDIASIVGVDDPTLMSDIGTYVQKEIARALDHIELSKKRFLKAFPLEGDD